MSHLPFYKQLDSKSHMACPVFCTLIDKYLSVEWMDIHMQYVSLIRTLSTSYFSIRLIMQVSQLTHWLIISNQSYNRDASWVPTHLPFSWFKALGTLLLNIPVLSLARLPKSTCVEDNWTSLGPVFYWGRQRRLGECLGSVMPFGECMQIACCSVYPLQVHVHCSLSGFQRLKN